MPRKKFGRYSSRLKKKAGSVSIGGGVAVAGSIKTGGGVAVAGSIKTGGGVSVGGGIDDVIDGFTKTADKIGKAANAVVPIFEAGAKAVGSVRKISKGGGFVHTKPRIPFDFRNAEHVQHTIDKLTNEQLHHVRSAAAFISGDHDKSRHHIILNHRHVRTAPEHIFRKLSTLDRAGLKKAVRMNPHMREALSNSMYSAHKGGNLDMTHAHKQAIHSAGGGFDFIGGAKTMFNKAMSLGNPIEEAGKAVDSFGKVDIEHAFDSPHNFAKAAVQGYAGNMHAWSAYGKTAALIPGVGEVEPVAMAMGVGADKLDSLAEEI